MGTRTYSRRRADGTRVPTALGRSTGKFTGEATTAGTTLSRVAQTAADVLKSSIFGNSTASRPFAFIGEGRDQDMQLQQGLPIRTMIGERDYEGYPEVQRQARDLERNQLDMFGGVTWSPFSQMVETGRISVSNMRRILDAGADAMAIFYESGRVPADLRETQPRGIQMTNRSGNMDRDVRQGIAELMRMAGLRSHVYDASVINPNAAAGEAGNFSGRYGRVLKARADRITYGAREIANDINRALGQRQADETTGLPPAGTTGRRIYDRIMRDTGAVAFRSAKKLARNNPEGVADMKAAVRAHTQRLGVDPNSEPARFSDGFPLIESLPR